MNTKTMRLPPRRVLTSSNKRKEREGFDSLKSTPPSSPPPPPQAKISKPTTTPQAADCGKLAEPTMMISSNQQLVAGYLAYEYLTKGTLLGQPWEPVVEPKQDGEEADEPPNNRNYQAYMEVSSLLKADGTHLPGVVNPSQLSRFLKM